MNRWRMEKACADCPFNESGPGLALRRSLRAGRWRGILTALRSDGHFLCHKTVDVDESGVELLCAGAIAWQDDRGLPSQLRRICERLEASRTRDRVRTDVR